MLVTFIYHLNGVLYFYEQINTFDLDCVLSSKWCIIHRKATNGPGVFEVNFKHKIHVPAHRNPILIL